MKNDIQLTSRACIRVDILLILLPILLIMACVSEGKMQQTLAALPFETVLTPAEMAHDLQYIRTTLENVHPSLEKGFTPGQEEIYQLAQAAASRPLRAQDFWFVCNAVVASVGDAHTRIGFPRESGRFPLTLFWLDEGGIVVTEETEHLTPGDRILRIGNMGETELFEECSKLIPAENDKWVRYLGAGLILTRAFHEYFGLADSTDDTLELTAVTQAGAEKNISLSYGTIEVTPPARHWIGREYFPEQNAMLFWLNTCRYNDEYKDFLGELFAESEEKGVEHIIIDVRKNTGGDSKVIDEFMSYIDVETYVKYGGSIRYSREASVQRGYFRKQGTKAFPPETVTNLRAEGAGYRGKLWVLTSQATFSSGNWFAVILSDNKLAKTVGEPTGNAPSSYGDILRFQAPNSRYVFTVSHKQWLRPDPARDPADALNPDMEIRTTVEGIGAGGDIQLETLLQYMAG